MAEILWKTTSTYADGQVVEETWTNPFFDTEEKVEAYCREEFGDQLVRLKISKVENGREVWDRSHSY